MAQRAIAPEDLLLIEAIETEVEGGYLVREKDFQAFDRELRRLRDRARKLVGKRIVLDGDWVITTGLPHPGLAGGPGGRSLTGPGGKNGRQPKCGSKALASP
jgi:hypothetical protein